jgi:hypothetical protein
LTPDSPAQSPVYIPPPAPAGTGGARKRGPVFWILTGCAGVLVIGVLVVVSTGLFVAYKARQAGLDPALIQKNPGLAVAKILASTNPEIEVLSVDEDRGIIKVREKKTGKTLTMSLEEVRNGRIIFYDENNKRVDIQASGEGEDAAVEIRSEDSSVRIGAGGARPAWLPEYPGATGAGALESSSAEGNAATLTYRSQDSAEDVITFYEEALRNSGFAIEKPASGPAGQPGLNMLVATQTGSKRSAHITAVRSPEGTMISVSFQDPK